MRLEENATRCRGCEQGQLRQIVDTRGYLIEKDRGADAGFGVAIEMGAPEHHARCAVSALPTPLKIFMSGSEVAGPPLLMFTWTVARNVEPAGTTTFWRHRLCP